MKAVIAVFNSLSLRGRLTTKSTYRSQSAQRLAERTVYYIRNI
jgi:hypothetical protein